MPRARILIVDDELYVRRALRRVFGRHDVVLAADGAEAIACLEGDQPFDVILCDLMMPRVSGLDLYEYVRDKRPGQERRIIFLTGGTIDDQTDESLAQITNRVLEKPFDFKLLRSAVEEVIGAGSDR